MENPGWDSSCRLWRSNSWKEQVRGGNLARIPATRLGVGFEVQKEKLDFGMNDPFS